MLNRLLAAVARPEADDLEFSPGEEARHASDRDTVPLFDLSTRSLFGFLEVLACVRQLTEGLVGKTPVEVGIGILEVEADGLVVVFDGTPKLAQVAAGNTPVVVGIGILGVEPDGLVVVLERPLELAQVGTIRETDITG